MQKPLKSHLRCEFLEEKREIFRSGYPKTDETHMPCHMGEEVLGRSDQKDPAYPQKGTSQMALKIKKNPEKRPKAFLGVFVS